MSFRAAGPIHALSLNPGGSLVALISGTPGAQWVETFERATKRRIARFSAGTTAAQPCARAQLLGDTVLVTTGACTARALPAPGAYLATPAGKQLALVGGDQPLALSSTPPVALGGHRWAFVAATGDTVVIHDASTGVVERRIATGAPVEPDMVTAGADTLSHLVLAFGGKHQKIREIFQGRLAPAQPGGQKKDSAPQWYELALPDPSTELNRERLRIATQGPKGPGIDHREMRRPFEQRHESHCGKLSLTTSYGTRARTVLLAGAGCGHCAGKREAVARCALEGLPKKSMACELKRTGRLYLALVGVVEEPNN